MSTGEDATTALRLSAMIKPILAGHDPAVQGAVLADLLSLWLAGHHPSLRAEHFKMHIDVVSSLVPASEAELFPYGLPDGWES